jgi:hypothetical protein
MALRFLPSKGIVCDNRAMNKQYNDPHNEAYVFKPPSFLFYYWQRIFIWGEWSISQARYYHRRDLLRYEQYQAQHKPNTDGV